MAKSRKRRSSRRRNPTGTLLVNPARSGRSKKRATRSKRAVTLASLLSRVTQSNPRKARRSSKRKTTRRTRRNPLVMNPRKRSRKAHARRRNGTYAVTNPRRGRKGRKAHARRRNPLMINPRKGRKAHARRRNPGFAGGIVTKAQGMVKRLPLVGGVLSAALGALGGAVGGGAGALGLHFAMGHLGRFFPSWLKPYGYTVAGALLSGAVKLLPVNIPYKAQLAIGFAAAGGAVDVYRMRIGKSAELGDDDYGDDEYGDYDLGDDELGNDGSPLGAVEYADASLMDAEYAGDDLSDEEIAAAELGRAAFRKRFMPKRKGQGSASPEGGSSDHAGKPGRRFAFLIYWIGFENFQKLAKMPDHERRQIIATLKHEALLRSRKLISQGIEPTVQQAETAGLLVAA